MSRRSLYKLEMEFSRILESWDRMKGKRAASKISFRPVLLPPEELVIQGLMRPEPPKRKHRKERGRRRRRVRRNFEAVKKISPEKALKTESRAISFLCRCCDFRDKLTGRCLILRLGGECPYMNGVYTHMPRRLMKVSARSR